MEEPNNVPRRVLSRPRIAAVEGISPTHQRVMKDVGLVRLQRSLTFLTEVIVQQEGHIEKLFQDWILDSDMRCHELGRLNRLSLESIRSYNTHLERFARKDLEWDQEESSFGLFPAGSDIPSFADAHRVQQISAGSDIPSFAIAQQVQPISAGSDIPRFADAHRVQPILLGSELSQSEIINTYLDTRDLLEVGNTSEKAPLSEVRSKILEMMRDIGSSSLDKYLQTQFNPQYRSLIPADVLPILDLYNQVFVPIGCYLFPFTKTEQKEDFGNLPFDPYGLPTPLPHFQVVKYESKSDSLVENSCCLVVALPLIKKMVVINGYVRVDIIGGCIRTSSVCSNYLSRMRRDTYSLLEKKGHNPKTGFFGRYFRLIGGNSYFCQDSSQLADQAIDDYQYSQELVRKTFALVIRDITHMSTREIFRTIKILLIGDERAVGTASLVFGTLRNLNNNGNILENIIYHNLSYRAQAKLKKANTRIRASTTHLKSLTVESIPLERRLVAMVNMPDNVKAYIMEKSAENDAESNYKVQTAINGLMQFPWKPKGAENQYSDIRTSAVRSRTYLQGVAQRLNEAVYGHENCKKVLIELVGKWIQNPSSSGQVIGLVGPPGIGKTLLAKSISRALDLPLSIVGLGGMSDSADLIGHSFTYAGAQYGMIVRQMIRAGSWRSVMFFDEVDKVSKRNDTNEIYNTLIHITDPNMNQNFQDRFYSSSIDFDLSGVLIVFSYNDSSKLDSILRDRIKEIKITAYSVREKITIAQNYVIKELCDSIGFDRSRIVFDDSVIRYIIDNYTFEVGVRELRRKLEQILLKINIDRFYLRGPFDRLVHARSLEKPGSNGQVYCPKTEIDASEEDVVSSYVNHTATDHEKLLPESELDGIFNLESEVIEIDIDLVHRYLEKPQIQVEEIQKSDMVGVVNGLYATSVGLGGIIPIQIYPNHVGDCQATSHLRLTGNQEKVMQESVSCAYTTAIRLLSKDRRERINQIYPHGFHIHAPDGATPKDGPSAGCAFATAFVSILLDKPINREVAMTGEIELTGKISKIGGLDAKLTGAKKAGVKVIYLCEENREDYLKLIKKCPELFGEGGLTVRIVSHITEIVSDPRVIIGVEQSDFS